MARTEGAGRREGAVDEAALVALHVLEIDVGLVERDRAGRRHGHAVALFRRLEIGQHHPHAGAVAGREEARQGQLGEERRPHRDGGVGVAEAVRRPGDRHEAQASREIWHVEADPGMAVGADHHRPREQRHGLEGVHVEAAHLLRRAGVAALDEAAGLALGVEQAAVDVAPLDAGLAPAEEVVGRVGRQLRSGGRTVFE